MRWIGTFNIGYGALGLASAIYLGRLDAVVLCIWVMSSGVLIRSGIPGKLFALIRSKMADGASNRSRDNAPIESHEGVNDSGEDEACTKTSNGTGRYRPT